ncbi:MAG: hypothetical protein OFPI_27830 [Osedax symbiont Rs2]|nr:MAG: hypothetical protein OFPI_27830 [Osedax symbiont Rs2]
MNAKRQLLEFTVEQTVLICSCANYLEMSNQYLESMKAGRYR